MIAGCPNCAARYRIEHGQAAAGRRAPALLALRGGVPRAARRRRRRRATPAERRAAAAARARVAPARAAAPRRLRPRGAPRRRRSGDASCSSRTPRSTLAKRSPTRSTRWGLSPLLVHDGVEALLQIQRTLPRAVVLDAALPKMFGFQICELMKRNEQLRAHPGRADRRDPPLGPLPAPARARSTAPTPISSAISCPEASLPSCWQRVGVPLRRRAAAARRAARAAAAARAPAPAAPPPPRRGRARARPRTALAAAAPGAAERARGCGDGPGAAAKARAARAHHRLGRRALQRGEVRGRGARGQRGRGARGRARRGPPAVRAAHRPRACEPSATTCSDELLRVARSRGMK